jgi:RanBP1 domain
MTPELLAEHMDEGWIDKAKLPTDSATRNALVESLLITRLNNSLSDIMTEFRGLSNARLELKDMDLRPLIANYLQIYDSIVSHSWSNGFFNASASSVPASFSDGSSVNFAPNNMFSNASAHNSMAGQNKRKANDDEDEDRAKRQKPTVPTPDSTPKSDTAKKLQGFLDSSNTIVNEQSQPASNPFPSTPPQNKKHAGSTPFKSTTAFNPSTAPSFDLSKAPASAPFKLFGAQNNSTNNGAAAPLTGFKPIETSATSASSISSGFKPIENTASSTTLKPAFGVSAAGGFKPVSGFKPAAVNGVNFMSQFGAKATKTAEEDKKRAKDEDFDSEDDDEAEWEARYAEKQKQRQKEFEEAAKNLPPPPKFAPTANATPKFSFITDTASNASTNGDALSRSVSPAGSVLEGPKPSGPHLFSHLSPSDAGKDDEEEEEEEVAPVNGTSTPSKEPSTGRSLFDRISKDKDSVPAENPGDHTWKPNSPIKFGGGAASSSTPFKFPTPSFGAPSPPSTGGGLFSSAKTPSISVSGPSTSNTPAFGSALGTSIFAPRPVGALAPPSTSSSSVIQSAGNSRASTPQLSELSDSGSAAADDDVPEEVGPASDLVNFAAATAGHTVLFERNNVKVMKHDKDANNPWPTQGMGPIAVLKNKETGVLSILMKASPSGKVVINTRLSPSLEYKQVKRRARFLVPKEGGMDSMLVQFASEVDSTEFVKICEENKGQ